MGMLRFVAVLFAVLGFACGVLAADAKGEVGPGVPAFAVRPGLRVTLASDKLEEARFLCFDDKGTLYCSQPTKGNIVALREPDASGVYRKVSVYIKDKPKVHAMCFHNGWLWFAQSTSIGKARGMKEDGSAQEIATIIPAGKLPGLGGHWWRSLLVDDDGFYTSIGDSTNLTDESKTNPDRQKIWHYNLEGGDKKLFASGIRNTERLLYRPGTKELYGCDHGTDNFGQKFGERTGQLQPITDLNPGEEFNHYVQGGFYGHPFLVGNNMPRPEFADREDIIEMAKTAIPPEFLFHAHWAPNGWRFVTSDYFPGFKGDAVICFHGSWNSVQKVGYRVERLLFDEWSGKPYGSLRLVGTLSEDGRRVLARPVDVIEAADGTLLWSADDTKQIYRISKADGK